MTKKKRTITKTAARNGTRAEKKNAKKKTVKPWHHVNRLQLAELLGLHPDTVSDYSRSGMPVITRGGRGRESKYDAVECLAWWRDQQGHNAKEAAQTRAYEAQAKLNELKFSRQREELYPREEILLAGQQQVKAWTAKIRALPRQLVQIGIIPPEEESRLGNVLRNLLTDICSWKTIEEMKKAARKRI